MEARKSPMNGRLFKSSWLEALSKTHIAVPLTLFYGAALGVLFLSTGQWGMRWSTVLTYSLSGVLFFTLVEYLVHRYFYHMRPGSERSTRIQYVFHGVHHDHPRDKRRLALPPIVSVVVAVAFLGLFRLLLGTPGFAFGGGFLAGYATYLLVHYSIHVRRMPHNLLSALWKHHNLHHFADGQSAFGVSSPMWDHVFGTLPADPRMVKQRSAVAPQHEHA
jgi:4-hydroxysphinganine ceramide fatty acyl 2-hydroxylase